MCTVTPLSCFLGVLAEGFLDALGKCVPLSSITGACRRGLYAGTPGMMF